MTTITKERWVVGGSHCDTFWDLTSAMLDTTTAFNRKVAEQRLDRHIEKCKACGEWLMIPPPELIEEELEGVTNA